MEVELVEIELEELDGKLVVDELQTFAEDELQGVTFVEVEEQADLLDFVVF